MNERFFAIGVGSNVGDRLAHLNRALAMIDRIEKFSVLATSRIYESKGWGRKDLDPFLNAVLVGRSSLRDAPDVLQQLQRIEDTLGRQRTIQWGPRTLDLDLIAVNDETHATDDLTLPHPWVQDRPFVYLPLREVEKFHPAFSVASLASEAGLRIEKDSSPLAASNPAWGFQLDPAATEAASATLRTHSEDETQEFAREFAPFLLPGDTIALNAPLGSGKSVFARGLARGLGIQGPIASPTYLLCKSYEAAVGPFEHWDFYRLDDRADLESTGYFSSPPNAIRVIEWAEKFPNEIINPMLSISISAPASDESGNLRVIEFRSSRGALPFPLRALIAAR